MEWMRWSRWMGSGWSRYSGWIAAQDSLFVLVSPVVRQISGSQWLNGAISTSFEAESLPLAVRDRLNETRLVSIP